MVQVRMFSIFHRGSHLVKARLPSAWSIGRSNGFGKSIEDIEKLINEVLLADDFDLEDVKGFSLTKEMKRLDQC